ncbi:hypothetical protein Pd630_LPD10118 (plasmid) [Rhodococcus opacus PD630]|nr:hypothetical protein Pd630_LPD10118 [Rhodococcus opacus PD630]
MRAEFYVDGDMIRGFGVELSWQVRGGDIPVERMATGKPRPTPGARLG